METKYFFQFLRNVIINFIGREVDNLKDVPFIDSGQALNNTGAQVAQWVKCWPTDLAVPSLSSL